MTSTSNVSRRTLIKGAAVAPFAGSAIFALAKPGSIGAQELTVNVGSKDFTEQLILGNMYLQVLQDLGIPAEDRLNLGGTQIAQQALVAGDIQMYPEYTGTALTEVVQLTVADVQGGATPVASPVGSPVASPQASPVAGGGDLSQAVYDTVAASYAEQFGLVWLERSPANNTQALAVQRAFSEENGITTISQLAAVAGDYIISAPSDFPERADGQLGLVSVYGETFNEIEVLPVAPGLKYQALLDDQAQVVLAFGTDGQISGYDLVVLEDDLGLWPPYNVAPVVRQEVLDAYPEVEDAFNAVTTSLTDEILSGLNWQVDGDEKLEPSAVATTYLTDNGFIGG
ncbi:MAG: quaternary ammonium transporter [Actinomycetota bacterium]|nr:quaternary ammonium transporter [Actinomycetota bacterium]